MLRVKTEALSLEDGNHYLEKNLFTGIAISLKDCIVDRLTEFSQGRIIGEYKNSYLPANTFQLRVDYSCLMQEYNDVEEPYYYKKKRFSGVAYEFEGIYCVTESVFEYGWVSDEISYFKSGDPEYIDIVENNFSQHAEYYESGRIKVVDLLEKNNFMTRYSFDEKGGIISLNIRGNYFERIKYFQEKIKFPIFTDRLFADDLYAGNHLYLSGDSVDDEIFYRLASNNSLGNTFKLNIVRTSVSAVCLDIIKYYPGIKQIIMESDIISAEEIKRFKYQQPNCYIKFNGENI